MVFVLLFTNSSLTAVPADKLTAAGKFIDRQTTVVCTSMAVCHRGGIFQLINLVDREHRCLFSCLITLSCDQSRTEGSHDSGDIRTDCFTAGNLFEASKYRVIIEGTALHHNMSAKLCRIRHLDNLVKSILDNRIGKTRRDIRYLRSLLLCLLYLGVHKYSTAGSEIDRMLCIKSSLCKILHTVIQ